MQLIILRRRDGLLIDNYQINGGTLNVDYLENPTSEIILDTPINDFEAKNGDWVVLLKPGTDAIQYLGFITNFEESNLQTKITTNNWIGAMVADVTTERYPGDAVMTRWSGNWSGTNFQHQHAWLNFGEFEDDSHLKWSYYGWWEKYPEVIVTHDMEYKDELLIDIFEWEEDADLWNRYKEETTFSWNDEKVDSDKKNRPFEYTPEKLVSIKRSDMLKQVFEKSGVMAYPYKLKKVGDLTYHVVFSAFNAEDIGNDNTFGPISSGIYPAMNAINKKVNLDLQEVTDKKIDNRRLDVMQPNTLNIKLFGLQYWTDSDGNEKDSQDATIRYNSFWFWKKSDGTVTNDRSDPDIIVPSVTKYVMQNEQAMWKNAAPNPAPGETDAEWKGGGTLDTASKRMTYAEEQLLDHSGGEYKIEFSMDLNNNFLIHSWEFPHDGTYVEKPTVWDNLVLGELWEIYTEDQNYKVKLTAYKVDLDNERITLTFGSVRSSMKYTINNLIAKNTLSKFA